MRGWGMTSSPARARARRSRPCADDRSADQLSANLERGPPVRRRGALWPALRTGASYEGQAAMELEWLATDVAPAETLRL